MYVPAIFREDDSNAIIQMIGSTGLASLITTTSIGLIGTPMPMFFDSSEGDKGVLYGHLSKANPQWQSAPLNEGLVIFTGPDAYITPSWYEQKTIDGRVVPTWNYLAVHVYGAVEFFDNPERKLEVVTRLTRIHEQHRPRPWAPADAPAGYMDQQLRNIIGVRIPVSRIEAKKKMSQNRSDEDRISIAQGLQSSERDFDRAIGKLLSDK